MSTRTEDSRENSCHAHLAETLVLNLEQQFSKLHALRLREMSALVGRVHSHLFGGGRRGGGTRGGGGVVLE